MPYSLHTEEYTDDSPVGLSELANDRLSSSYHGYISYITALSSLSGFEQPEVVRMIPPYSPSEDKYKQ